MAIIRRFLSAIGFFILIMILIFLLGGIIGQPFLLSYIETGSMEPTLNPGDGFVAIPSELAGPIQPGDVVVYEAEQIQGGGLTTHRIAEETDRGFITKGDANPFTDQDSGEPPVKRAEIVAVAWQPGENVLAIPGVGTLVTGTQSVLETLQRELAVLLGTRAVLGVQGLAYLLFALSIGLYGLDVWRASGADRERSRSRSRDTGTSAHLYAAVFAGAVVIAATAAMVVPAGTTEYGVVSAEFESQRPTVIEHGTSESLTQVHGNGGFLPVVSFFEPETDGIDVEPRRIEIPARSTVNTTITLSVPPDTGYYRYFLTQHRYLYLLPISTIESLYRLHPWTPILAVDALLGIPVFLLTIRMLGTGRIRSRARDKPSWVRRRISGLL